MAIATSNRLLPLLAGVVVLMLAFVTIKSCSNEPNDQVVMNAVPQAPVPDADTPADTIKTLIANVAAMTAEVEALRQNNTKLHNDNRQLLNNRVQIEENVTTRVKRELLSREHDQEARGRMDSSVLSSLTARVDALSQSLSHGKPTQGAGDIPVGLGFDGGGAGAAPVAGMVWITPLDAIDDDASAANGNSLLHQVRQSTGGALSSAREQTGNIARELDTLQPVYTVPRNATLIDSTAMTALVGRVPVRGQVRDPMPFKVITGADNLAANGLSVPGVQGMVWSGTAIGDWTLSCVTGRLDSVTFVFDDGTIRTISSDDRGGQSGGNNRPLGWISDQQGIPCISGERKTNAPAFLTQRIGVMAVQAAAAAETTSVVSDTGAATNNVTGDAGTYVLGKTIAGGSDEVAKWLLERQSQSFDAVFVPAGTSIAIHVDRELPIDLDLKGRKLNHAKSINPYHRARLD
ncbi:integrating conjugative element protein [Solemya velum gill symbiont]|uniref:TIGR03752 family integrating conjugative element protein n=1 Tax=Solemya velum gill symbiont TaxID=2340 RepID=UPI000996F02F|nr:TIGR03752 family integrating conjugative element protein [Solemya velum gill symbiont]OOZ76505.1 integrating conjugative element protein [Solemya velum gill symbiont]